MAYAEIFFFSAAGKLIVSACNLSNRAGKSHEIKKRRKKFLVRLKIRQNVETFQGQMYLTSDKTAT